MTAVASDQTQISDLLDAYQTALNTSDAAAAAALYAPDGEFYPYNLATSVGADIRDSYEAIFSAIKLDIAFDVREVAAAGDIAYAITRSKGHVTVLEPGISVAEENREVFVFFRVDNAWKIGRYMFNKSAAPALPEA